MDFWGNYPTINVISEESLAVRLFKVHKNSFCGISRRLRQDILIQISFTQVKFMVFNTILVTATAEFYSVGFGFCLLNIVQCAAHTFLRLRSRPTSWHFSSANQSLCQSWGVRFARNYVMSNGNPKNVPIHLSVFCWVPLDKIKRNFYADRQW